MASTYPTSGHRKYFEYFFSKAWSAELVLTYPQEHDVTVKGATIYPAGAATTVPSVKIGTFKELPPTLTLKYNFLPDAVFRPYVGVGINVTSITDVNLNVPTVGAVKLDSTTVGAAVQADLTNKWRPAGSLMLMSSTFRSNPT